MGTVIQTRVHITCARKLVTGFCTFSGWGSVLIDLISRFQEIGRIENKLNYSVRK